MTTDNDQGTNIAKWYLLEWMIVLFPLYAYSDQASVCYFPLNIIFTKLYQLQQFEISVE
jgi:hypothetical protein